jgi:hypothetical protein
MRSTPNKISYIDSKDTEALKEAGLDGEVNENNKGNISFIVEEWKIPDVNYSLYDSTNIKYESKGNISESRVWELTLENTEDESEKEVTNIKLHGTDISIDLSGFVVTL